ncbi:hypothetical protein B0H10DRAFT_2438507 [Mycena sp. CBHHK59/15]|nr:hypothetical protein B0H10DRAFT_2438507 [Mycena sp. CBHHK59/15]
MCLPAGSRPSRPSTISLFSTSPPFNGGFAIANNVNPQDNKAVIALPDVVPGYVSSLYPSIRIAPPSHRLRRILTQESIPLICHLSYAPHLRANSTLPPIYRPRYKISFTSMADTSDVLAGAAVFGRMRTEKAGSYVLAGSVC